MTETKRVGGKGIYICGPHGQATCNQVEEGQSCDMQSGRVQDISLMYTYKLSENTTIKTNSDTNIMLKDGQNSITSQRINMSSQVIYSGECMHVK